MLFAGRKTCNSGFLLFLCYITSFLNKEHILYTCPGYFKIELILLLDVGVKFVEKIRWGVWVCGCVCVCVCVCVCFRYLQTMVDRQKTEQNKTKQNKKQNEIKKKKKPQCNSTSEQILLNEPCKH